MKMIDKAMEIENDTDRQHIIFDFCPDAFDLEEYDEVVCKSPTCTECWDREYEEKQ